MTSLFELGDGCVRFRIDLRIHRPSAVKKVAYKLADRCTAVLRTVGEFEWEVALAFPIATREEVVLATARTFLQELLDQDLREEIGDETRAVRSLILAAAYSKTGLIQHE